MEPSAPGSAPPPPDRPPAAGTASAAGPAAPALSPRPAPLALGELLLLPASFAAILALGRMVLDPDVVRRHPVLWLVRLAVWLHVWACAVAARDAALGPHARFFPAFRQSIFAGTAAVALFLAALALQQPALFLLVFPLSAFAVQRTISQSSDTGPEREHWARLPMVLAIAHVFLLLVLTVTGLLALM